MKICISIFHIQPSSIFNLSLLIAWSNNVLMLIKLFCVCAYLQEIKMCMRQRFPSLERLLRAWRSSPAKCWPITFRPHLFPPETDPTTSDLATGFNWSARWELRGISLHKVPLLLWRQFVWGARKGFRGEFKDCNDVSAFKGSSTVSSTA